MTNLIIDRPQWQTRGQRMVFGSLRVVFWAVWIYLWLPILGFVGWLLGVRLAYDQMIVKGGYVGLLHLLGVYALIILALGASLLVWAYYNYFRFRGKDRRSARAPVSVVNLTERYAFPAETIDRWIGARRLVLHHNREGRLVGADI